jgi:hypothetical protein
VRSYKFARRRLVSSDLKYDVFSLPPLPCRRSWSL